MSLSADSVMEGADFPTAPVSTSRARSSRKHDFADVPTLAEAGVADAEYPLWYGSFVPARTPRHIVETLHRETSKALKTPNVENKLATLGLEPMVMTPAEFDAHVKAEIRTNAALISAAGIK
jgi:tripartite-type tricarboxylate transporter receptor subunit TctC